MRGFSLLRFLLLALVVGMLGVGAGCGGGSDNSASSDDEPDVTETSEEITTDEETTEDETTTDEEMTEDETTTDEAEDSGDSDISGVASANDCEDLGELSRALSQALAGQDVDVDRYSTFLNEFAARTPEEIRPDFQVLADAWETYAEVIGDLDLASGEIPSASEIAELQQAFQDIDQEEVAEASTNIGTWVQENCTP